MKQISILGCGWLGLPLAKTLLENGFKVNGSTTSDTKISVLEKNGIQPYLVALSAVEGFNDEKEINLFLKNSEILIIDIPPKLRVTVSENFVKKIQNLIPHIEKSTVEKVIFVSSTAVYNDLPLNHTGSDKNWITENVRPEPDTESGKQLLEAEFLLQNNKDFQATIVRFGGLIGDDRHPITFLAGRKNIENPDGPINLIHQKDCIGIIDAILRQAQKENWKWNEVFNAVAPFHPSRKDYYTQKAVALNLEIPEFDGTKTSIGKTVLSEKIERVLGYTFQEQP